MKVRFWGVRGSIPSPGPSTSRHGGNTPCVSIEWGTDRCLVLDAGTGIRSLGQRLAGGDAQIHVLLSHSHWDHIQGFPFFAPARLRHNGLAIIGERRVGGQLKQILANHMSHADLPFTLEDLDAHLSFKEVQDGERTTTGDCTAVLPRRLSHPGGVLGYRISCRGKTIAYATDVGHPLDHLDPRVVDLAQDADLMIHDAHFTPQQKQELPNWGHSSWVEAVEVAQEANVRRLALFHHDPEHDDDFILNMEKETQKRFPNAFFAREGSTVEI